MRKKAFTTTDIARICHHSRETIKRWLERGKIKGYRIGTSGHWRVTPGATLVGTDVSPGYLRDHLLRALDGAGAPPALMLVTPLPPAAAWHGLPPEGEEWMAGEAG